MDPMDFPAPAEGFVITHFLVVSDQDRSRDFYQSLFDYEIFDLTGDDDRQHEKAGARPGERGPPAASRPDAHHDRHHLDGFDGGGEEGRDQDEADACHAPAAPVGAAGAVSWAGCVRRPKPIPRSPRRQK